MKSPNLMTHGKKIAALAVMLSLTAPAANAASGPFARMAGAWSGDGRVVLSDGQVERIRCRASNDVGGGGDLMRQHLRCASPSYSFDVQNTVTSRRGAITGSWNETTHNVGGQSPA